MQRKTNKRNRHRIKMLKYKQRLKVLGLNDKDENSNYTAYRSHGKPCSCNICSPYKYSRKPKDKIYENEKQDEINEYFNPEV